MHVQLIARRPSTHPQFTRKTEFEPKRFRWLHSENIAHRFQHDGPVDTAYMRWGVYGMIRGVVESLSEHPMQGTVTVKVAEGRYEVSGQIEIFDPARQPVIYESLLAIDRLARDLSLFPTVKTVDVTFTQKISAIDGGIEVE